MEPQALARGDVRDRRPPGPPTSTMSCRSWRRSRSARCPRRGPRRSPARARQRHLVALVDRDLDEGGPAEAQGHARLLDRAVRLGRGVDPRPAESGAVRQPSAAASSPAASRAAASAIRVEVDAVSVSSPSKASRQPERLAQPARRRPSRAPSRSARSATASGSGRGPRSASRRGSRARRRTSRSRRGTPGAASGSRSGTTRRSTSARIASIGSGSSGACAGSCGAIVPGSMAGRTGVRLERPPGSRRCGRRRRGRRRGTPPGPCPGHRRPAADRAALVGGVGGGHRASLPGFALPPDRRVRSTRLRWSGSARPPADGDQRDDRDDRQDDEQQDHEQDQAGHRPAPRARWAGPWRTRDPIVDALAGRARHAVLIRSTRNHSRPEQARPACSSVRGGPPRS